jgi:hypothetical protein
MRYGRQKTGSLPLLTLRIFFAGFRQREEELRANLITGMHQLCCLDCKHFGEYSEIGIQDNTAATSRGGGATEGSI